MKGPSLYGSPMKQDKSKKVKARATGPRFDKKAKVTEGAKEKLTKKKKTSNIPFANLRIEDGKYMYGKIELLESEYKNALRLNKKAGY